MSGSSSRGTGAETYRQLRGITGSVVSAIVLLYCTVNLQRVDFWIQTKIIEIIAELVFTRHKSLPPLFPNNLCVGGAN